MDATAPGRLVADQFVGDPRGFLRALARRYFEVTVGAVRAVDASHLILGVRSVSILTPAEVVSEASPFVDVFSVNVYEYVPYLEETLGGGLWPLCLTRRGSE